MYLTGPVSHTSTQYRDFVEIFNISLDLSTSLVGVVRASFVYCGHSIP